MAGIYLHIPFCKQACHYCDFHFSTSMARKGELVTALLTELELRRAYLNGAVIDTIYFGGGTPSLLETEELDRLLERITQLFEVSSTVEITLEANPDDLTVEKSKALSRSAVNRLSIGIQSFFDEDLQFMNRAHSAQEALASIYQVQAEGFQNLTIDLIYGVPTCPDDRWRQNIEQFLQLNIPHVSCYCLTVEPNTALNHFVATGKVPAPDEAQASRQFQLLVDELEANGYDHYEISNFAKPEFYSRHNSSYWKGKPYLGIGPSAHSYDGRSRQWNVANNSKYLSAIREKNQKVLFEKEVLAPEQLYNEYVLTNLRTIWGVDLIKLGEIAPGFSTHFEKAIRPYLQQGLVEQQGTQFTLRPEGKLFADKIAADTFFVS